jgi:tetratricopeptide (TPR) repeat protein
MESAAGHELDPAGVELARALRRETDGNPFFVAELLRDLVESGAIRQDTTGHWSPVDPGGGFVPPDSVREVIGTRVSRLGEESELVLSTASVIGRDFDLDLLEETTKIEEDVLIDLLEGARRAALASELVTVPGRYTFSHALVQHTLYEAMGPTRRTRLHRVVGEAMEHLYGEGSDARVGELARHFRLAARPADHDKAIGYARRAGEGALKALAPDDAVHYFSQALGLSQQRTAVDPILRIDLLTRLGTAERQAGMMESRDHLLDAARDARQIGDTERLVAAVLANNRGWFSSLTQQDTEKIDLLEAALTALGAHDSPERARLLATLCSELDFWSDLQVRLELADEAKAIARRLEDVPTLVDVVNRTHTAVTAPSTAQRQLADATEVWMASRELKDPARTFEAALRSNICTIRSGQFDLARRHLAEMQDLAEELRQPTWLWQSRYAAACNALIRGDTTEAEALASSAFDVASARGEPDGFAYYAAQLMRVRHQQGRLGEMLPVIAEAVEQYPDLIAYKAVHIGACVEAGEDEVARALMDDAAARGFSVPEDAVWFDSVMNYAFAAVELRLVGPAGQLFELLAPFHDQVPCEGVVAFEPVASILGGLATVIGRFEQADSYFDEAAGLNRRGEMRYAQALTSLLWGRMLQERLGPGDGERAQEHFEQARGAAARGGYALIERRATDELAKMT